MSRAHDHLLVFLRAAEPGRVKTRLAARVGRDRAAVAYRRMVSEVLDMLGGWSRPDAVCTLLVTPPDPVDDYVKQRSERFGILPQSDGDLGVRLAAAFRDAFDDGARRVAVIGTDCVEVTPEHLDQAFDTLDDCDAVVGPSMDGGYWLLGLDRMICEVFQCMPWGTPQVLRRTMARLGEHGCVTRLLPELRDLDTFEDVVAAGRTDLLFPEPGAA